MPLANKPDPSNDCDPADDEMDAEFLKEFPLRFLTICCDKSQMKSLIERLPEPRRIERDHATSYTFHYEGKKYDQE